MEPIVYLIAILGCGDGSQMCRQQRVEPTPYATMQACRDAMPAALARNTDIDYPTIAADCRASGPLIAARPATPRGCEPYASTPNCHSTKACRSDAHTPELQSPMRPSYAVFG